MSPATLRAALLATAALAASLFGRRPDLVTLTMLLAAVQLAWRPADLHSLGFQLSLASTLALVLVFSGANSARRFPGKNALLAVAAAQLATIPIDMTSIGNVPMSALFVNAVVGPLAAIGFPLALAGAFAGAVSPAIGQAVAIPGEIVARVILWFVQWAAEILPATVATGYSSRSACALVATLCVVTIFWLSQDVRVILRHLREGEMTVRLDLASIGLTVGAALALTLGWIFY